MIPAGNDVQQIHPAGSSIENLHPLRELMSLLQRLHHANTDPLVGEQDVAGAEYEYVERAGPSACVSDVGRSAPTM